MHPKKTGAEVMLALQENDILLNGEKKLFSTLIELLSYEKIIFNGSKGFIDSFILAICGQIPLEYLKISFAFSRSLLLSHVQ